MSNSGLIYRFPRDMLSRRFALIDGDQFAIPSNYLISKKMFDGVYIFCGKSNKSKYNSAYCIIKNGWQAKESADHTMSWWCGKMSQEWKILDAQIRIFSRDRAFENIMRLLQEDSIDAKWRKKLP